MKHCPKCGALCPWPGQKFCPKCGAPLSDTPPQAAPGWGGGAAGAVPRKYLIAAAAAVAVVLAGIAIWALTAGRGEPAAPVDAPAPTPAVTPVKTPESAHTAETAESAEPKMEPDRLYLEGLPETEALTLTADGVTVPWQYDAYGRLSIDQSAVTQSDTLLRAVLPQSNGRWLTSVALVSRPGNQTASFGALSESDEQGCSEQPDDDFIDTLLAMYYRSLLKAYNSRTVADLRFSTDMNDQSYQKAITDGAYNAVAYDLEASDMWFTLEGIAYREGTVTLNATGQWYGTNRKTGADEAGTEYLTIQLLWRDGMWQVDRCMPCSEQDYNSGVLRITPPMA